MASDFEWCLISKGLHNQQSVGNFIKRGHGASVSNDTVLQYSVRLYSIDILRKFDPRYPAGK